MGAYLQQKGTKITDALEGVYINSLSFGLLSVFDLYDGVSSAIWLTDRFYSAPPFNLPHDHAGEYYLLRGSFAALHFIGRPFRA